MHGLTAATWVKQCVFVCLQEIHLNQSLNKYELHQFLCYVMQL